MRVTIESRFFSTFVQMLDKALTAVRDIGLRGRQLTGIILASALVTLDGTATTLALPAIGRDLSASVSRLQWMAHAPLLVLASLLLPAGVIADRYGRVRIIQFGLLAFVAGSLTCAVANSDESLIGGKFPQGVGAAFVLPAALPALRGASADAAERAYSGSGRRGPEGRVPPAPCCRGTRRNVAVARGVPDACAGAASGLNHAVARAAGLSAVALLGSIAAPGVTDVVQPKAFSVLY